MKHKTHCTRRCTPLIPALRMQKQVDLCEYESAVVYTMSFRLTRLHS